MATMRVSYVGVFDEVFVPDINAPAGTVVRRGQAVEVPVALGEHLLEQEGNWVRAATRPASPSGRNADTGQQ
jgi:hypothetical protein